MKRFFQTVALGLCLVGSAAPALAQSQPSDEEVQHFYADSMHQIDSKLLREAITAALEGQIKADQEARAHTRAVRRTFAAVASVVGLGLGVGDCTQSAYRITYLGFKENNKATPQAVLTQFHANKSTLCIVGWTLGMGANYAITQRSWQGISAAAPAAELLNMLDNWSNSPRNPH